MIRAGKASSGAWACSRRGQHGRPQFMVNTIAVISHPGATAATRVRALSKQVLSSRGWSVSTCQGVAPRAMPYPALTARRGGT